MKKNDQIFKEPIAKLRPKEEHIGLPKKKCKSACGTKKCRRK